jgi:hypothetical protein
MTDPFNLQRFVDVGVIAADFDAGQRFACV